MSNWFLKDWIQRAFFRRTSKLAIDFAIQEGQCIHFCLDLDPKDERAEGLAHFGQFADRESTEGVVPITQSELRYINRKYGFDHPQIDFFTTNAQGQTERLEDLGKLTSYLERRTQQGRPNKRYEGFLSPEISRSERQNRPKTTAFAAGKRQRSL